MKCFADEHFYRNIYLCGKKPLINDFDFPFYARKATTYIRQHTFDNVKENKDFPEELQMCCCEVAELIYSCEILSEEANGVVSESVGGWSKTFETAEKRQENLERKITDCIERWLLSTGLLYKGVIE